ncbi:hypothetical protein M378DRAFT_163663 [Amanita muscaria Koide BX008]|uniref:Uncharacterized protein n=1 Tax=Amanita muscaria (strain Koide BX008) TaxID=946122 RepID=A0A0C2TBR9_AMAMK|nr:hypothetical protein M378DRAFT_163663 [Amanita muscaria Koide BX008]
MQWLISWLLKSDCYAFRFSLGIVYQKRVFQKSHSFIEQLKLLITHIQEQLVQ